MNGPKPSRQAFTLVEVMVAIALFSLCTAMVMGAFVRTINVATSAVRTGVMHREMRNALGRMTRDIHQARNLVTYGDGVYFAVLTPTPSGDVTVYYWIINRALYRFVSTGGGWKTEILGRNFDGLDLRLLDLVGQDVANPSAVVVLNVRLRGRTTKRGLTHRDAVETQVRMRNKQV